MVKVNYGALQTMSSTTSSASQGRVAGYQQLISAFSTFSGSYDLQGAGYDATRAYASGIMVSIIRLVFFILKLLQTLRTFGR